jgi:hypothetical protein
MHEEIKSQIKLGEMLASSQFINNFLCENVE